VLAHIYASIPDVTVDWLVERSFAPMLESHPLIRNVICLDTRRWRTQGITTAINGSLEVIQQLRCEKYDVALDLQGNSKSGLFTLFSGARKRFGFDRSQVREWPNLLATNRRVSIPPEKHHISSRYLQIAQAAFPNKVNVSMCGPLPIQPQAAQTIESLLVDFGLLHGKFLVAHYGTTWETKLWPLDHWIELIKILTLENGRQVVLTWGNDEEHRAAKCISEACQGRAIIWPRGTLQELVALFAVAQLVIGADTGPIHIAAAVGTPTLSIYRVTDSRRNGPLGDGHICLQTPMVCSPCMRKSCERDRDCGQSILVEEVLGAVNTLLSRQTDRP
jgi:heptosyltransferase-1